MRDNRKDSDILNKMKGLSGGLAIIPPVLVVTIVIFFPQAFQTEGYITALFYDGNPAMVGLFLIVCGLTISIRQVGMPLYKGVTLTGVKPPLGVAVDLLMRKLCGLVDILGLTPFVLIAAITNSSGSLYISLLSQPGNATDTGAISILSLNDSPFFTLMAPGATGPASIPFKALVAILIPLLIGFIRGSMGKGSCSTCATAQPIITFFMTISIDSKTDVSTLVTVGASGTVLGLISMTTAVVFFFVFNLLLPEKEHNVIGAVAGTTALNSVMMLMAAAQANPSTGPYVDMATAWYATVSIITPFLCPFIATFFDGWMRKSKRDIYSPEGWVTGKA